jgi:hypothetical protein
MSRRLNADDVRALASAVWQIYERAYRQHLADDDAFVRLLAATKSADVIETLVAARLKRVTEQMMHEVQELETKLDPARIKSLVDEALALAKSGK